MEDEVTFALCGLEGTLKERVVGVTGVGLEGDGRAVADGGVVLEHDVERRVITVEDVPRSTP